MEVRQEILKADGSGPRRCQLHGQRDAVEPSADLRNHLELLWLDLYAKSRRRGPIGEQPNRWEAVELAGIVGRRQPQRLDREDDLAQEPDGLPTRAEDRHLAARLGDLADQGTHHTQHMLAIVAHEEHVLAANPLEDAVAERTPASPDQPQTGRYGRRDCISADRREVDHPDTVAETVTRLGGHLDRESGLPDTAGSDERDGAGPRHQRAQPRELVGSPVEAGGGHSYPRGGLQGPERWGALGQPGIQHPVDLV